MDICVVTGASSGMGRVFVKELEKINKFDEICLIARREERLKQLSKEIETKTRILVLDLEKKESIEAYKDALAEANPNVKILVNASGFGKFGAFTDISLEDD